MTSETPDLITLLDGYNANTLRDIATQAGLETTLAGSRKKLPKDDLVLTMAERLFSRSRVEQIWEQLSKTEQAIINRLLLRGGRTATRTLKREVVRAGLATEPPEKTDNRSSYHYYGYSTYERDYKARPHNKQSTIFEDIVGHLTLEGLVLSMGTPSTSGGTPAKLRFTPGNTLIIPAPVKAALPEPEPIPSRLQAWQAVKTQTGDPNLFLRNLYLYWDYTRRNKVAILQSGLVGKRSLKAINSTLLIPDPKLDNAQREDQTDRLLQLRKMLEGLNLVKISHGQLNPIPPEITEVPEFWQAPMMEQVQACLEVWSTKIVPTTLGVDYQRFNPRSLNAFEEILRALKTTPSQTWLDIDELIETLQDNDPDFLFTEHRRVAESRQNWYYSYSGSYFSGQRDDLVKQMETLEAQFVRETLTGFLFDLGLLELGYASQETSTPTATWLTDLGQAVIHQTPNPAADTHSGKLIIQPSFHLLTIGPVSLATLATLDLFAERTNADRGAFEYNLNRESVYAGQQAGLTVSDIIEFLTTESDSPLPQNVQRSLEEWGAYHERIVFRRGVSLLQTADEALLTTLWETAGINKQIARTLTPTVALVDKAVQTTLVTDLIEANHLPAVAGAEPSAADRSIIIAEDGSIEPIHAVPSLHLRGRLARVAEEVNGGWHLSQKRVQKAGGSRKKVLAMLDELGKLHRGPLPQAIISRVQTWGGYFGQAAVETLTLVEFESREILQDLLEHPDLTPYLSPFSAGNRALAIIQSDALAEVKSILERLGVRLSEGLKS